MRVLRICYPNYNHYFPCGGTATLQMFVCPMHFVQLAFSIPKLLLSSEIDDEWQQFN